jgi:tetratricopeptide (TPR) repeat protein
MTAMRFGLVFALALAACGGKTTSTDDPTTTPDVELPGEATSLLGKQLYPPPLDTETRSNHDEKLAEARAAFDANDTDVDAIIWLGRRTAYLGRFRDAIEVYTRGIELHPDDARLYRHRGHRYISVREIDLAIADLERAAELRAGAEDVVEPDGLPNAQNIPLSTLHTNIFYHLGLAHYLRADYEEAINAYRKSMNASKNDDMVVATAYWLYFALRRAGHDGDAETLLDTIATDLELIEYTGYYALLLLFKGERTVAELQDEAGEENPTIGYGIATWHALAGHEDAATRTLEWVTQGTQWPAFGHIAAEADLARRR